MEIFFQIEKKTSYSKNSAFVAMQQALTPPPSKIKYNALFRGEILEYNRSRLARSVVTVGRKNAHHFRTYPLV